MREKPLTTYFKDAEQRKRILTKILLSGRKQSEFGLEALEAYNPEPK